MSIIGIGFDIAASFRVEQNGANDFRHIAPVNFAALNIAEHIGDATNVSRCRVAGDELLNQQFADKRRDVRMIEDIVNRRVQIVFGG